MNTSRLPVALAIIGAFVGGLCVGVFVNNGSLSSTAASVANGVEHASNGAMGRRGSSGTKTTGGKTDDSAKELLSGDELVKRVWTTLTIADENERHAEWLRLLPKLTREDALAIRGLFQKMDAEGRRFDFEWFSFWPKWGELDGPGALAYLSANESASWRPTAAEMLLRGWSKSDPNAARAWLTANAASPFYEGALRGYLDGVARLDLARATSEALVLGSGKDMAQLTEVLVEQALQQRQINGMVEWWRTLPEDSADGSARKAAVEHVYSRLQTADVDRAQTWMTELAATPYRSDDQLGEVAEKIAAANPARAVEWVASLPPSPQDGHYIAIGRTMHAWGEQDAPAAETWLNSLDPSPLRDQAIVAYARYLQGIQSPATDQWLAQVQDKTLLQPRNTAQTFILSDGPVRLQRSGNDITIDTLMIHPSSSGRR